MKILDLVDVTQSASSIRFVPYRPTEAVQDRPTRSGRPEKEGIHKMTRVELAAERCELQPLTVDPSAPPVAIALWGLFIGAAAIAYAVAYGLHGGVADMEDIVSLDETMDSPTIGELLAARQDA